MESAAHDLSRLFVELGAIVVGLAALARIASSWGFSAIPLYLLAGLAFGNGGVAPLNLSAGFVHIGAEIGVLLLLFMLGLEYTGTELLQNLRSGFLAALLDFALNFTPGLLAGLLLGWTVLPATLLGGITYVSSSGVIAKVLGDFRLLGNPETPVILSILVLEDLAMAIYLPIVAVLLGGGGLAKMAVSVAIAVAAVSLALLLASRYGPALSRLVAHESDEIVLLTTFGTVLVVAGIAQRLQVSSAVGAFLVGIAVSGPMAKQTHRLLAPIRDLFAATFFFFFGLQIDPSSLVPVLWPAVALGVITAATKVLAGYWASGGSQADRRGRLRAGMALVARGEFSIVIAGLGVALQPQLGPLSAAYVLCLAVAGPVLVRLTK